MTVLAAVVPCLCVRLYTSYIDVSGWKSAYDVIRDDCVEHAIPTL